MGHVQKRGPKRWIASYVAPDGRRRAQSFERKLDADRFLASVTIDVLRGGWVDPRAGRVTLGDYARQWVRERPIRPSTRERYGHYLAHLGQLDETPLGDLRPSALRVWQQQLGEQLAPSTVATIRGVIAAVLKSAIVDRLISASPLDGVPLPPRAPRQIVRPIPAERVLALRDAITPRYGAAIILGAGTGMRRGEAMGLTVDRLDWLRRTVTVDRQLVCTSPRDGEIFGPPKTAASVRQIPMPQSVVDALAAHLAAFPAGQHGLVFTAPRGGPVYRSKMGAAWLDAEVRIWAGETGRQLGRDARIPADALAEWKAAHPDGHGHRFHDLRHFYASTLIADGRSVKTVQARLGHATAAETLDTYAHLWPDDEDRTRSAIDAMFAPRVERADVQTVGL